MSLTDHSAPGPAAGYSFQFERALYRLAESPAGSTIGIETGDDVVVRSSDGSLQLEQNKHSIGSSTNPFADRAKGSWNTLAIWLDALESGEVKPECARFFMVTNQTVPNCIARQVGAAEDDAAGDACIAALEEAATQPSATIKKLTKRVLPASSRGMLRQLICKISVADATDAMRSEELRKKTTSELQLPEWCGKTAESIADELLGWLHTQTLRQWQENKPAWIHRDHFVNELHAIKGRRHREIARERAESLLPVSDAALGEQKESKFVKQLYLVTDDDSLVGTAIREFIRCNIEKGRLSAEGNISDADWIAFEAALFTRWVKIRRRLIRMSQGASEEDVGFGIFTETTESYCEKLAGVATDQVYLTAGTYHRLAEILKVGWHPRYSELMGEGSAKK